MRDVNAWWLIGEAVFAFSVGWVSGHVEERRRRQRYSKTHIHWGHTWDGYYEHCKCGISAGDYRDPKTGQRAIEFIEWPAELREVKKR